MKQTEIVSDGLKKTEISLNGQDLKHLPRPEEPSLTSQDGNEMILTPIDEIYEDLLTDLGERTAIPKYPTGLKDLDEIIWGLHKRELMVIGGRTSMGKSMMAIHLARELIEQQQRVIYFSLEMNKRQLLERFLSNVCEINSDHLRKGLANDKIKERSSLFQDWMMDAKLLIDDMYGYKFDNILKICNYIKPDFIIVDYVQLVSTRGYKDKLSALEDFVKSLHNLCIKDNFGAILISQINRSGADSLTMDKLKGAGVLEEVPDSVMLLKWDWDTGKYTIKVDKQRHGECGSVDVDFEPEYARFANASITLGIPSGQANTRLRKDH